MIEVHCSNCGQQLRRSPSKVEPRNYCSRVCYAKIRDKELIERGKPYRITTEINAHLSEKRIKALRSKTMGDKHYSWKGQHVGYRGLHYWIRRKLGAPVSCVRCGAQKTTPRSIQWANIDGHYRRVLADYISLCASCHKFHDLALKKSTQDAPSATQ